jgi:hypothetical protein
MYWNYLSKNRYQRRALMNRAMSIGRSSKYWESCRNLSVHSGEYEDSRHLRCGVVWFLRTEVSEERVSSNFRVVS